MVCRGRNSCEASSSRSSAVRAASSSSAHRWAESSCSILNGLGFQLQGANDLFDRTHSHSFFENADVVYTGPVPPPVLDHINATVARYSATPDAVNYLEHYYEPDGHLAIPFLAMATT